MESKGRILNSAFHSCVLYIHGFLSSQSFTPNGVLFKSDAQYIIQEHIEIEQLQPLVDLQRFCG